MLKLSLLVSFAFKYIFRSLSSSSSFHASFLLNTQSLVVQTGLELAVWRLRALSSRLFCLQLSNVITRKDVASSSLSFL